jgi:hypothetical protein
MTRIPAWFKAQSSSSKRLGLIALVIMGMSAAACTAGSDNADESANDLSGLNDGYSRLPYIAQGSGPNHGQAPGQIYLLK